MEKSICELVREAESNDSYDTIHSKYVSLNMREDIDKTDAYLNSKHTSGEIDSLGREKPFFNISIAARNIWFRATDIDRKNIRTRAVKESHQVLAFVANLLLQEWMKKNGLGQFLNNWGLALANYGSAISKFVEKDGELHCEVASWNRMLVDPIDFKNNLKIEKLWLTPAQLRKNKSYNKELVKKLIEAQKPRETIDKRTKDNRPGYILVYEVHGELPLARLTDREEDEETYIEQMHVVSFMAKKEGEYEDYTLYKGKEDEVYDITHLIEQDGYTFSGGAVKYLFEAQWMANHTAKTIKDHLDLASKIFFQGSSGNFVGQNALVNMESGQYLLHAQNEPVTLLNNRPDTVSLQNQGMAWKALGNEQVGISESMLGINPPSGTAWGLEEAKLREAHTLFNLMIQNKGLALERMLRKFVIPFLKTKMDTSEEISAILEDHQITQLDSMYVPNEAIRRNNRKIIDKVLAGKTEEISPEWQAMDTQQEAQSIQRGLNRQGNQRFIKPSDIKTETWKKALKDFEWEIEVDITGEAVDPQATMATLQTALQYIVGLQGRPMTPDEKLVFNKLISFTGAISPIELNQSMNQPMGQTVNPVNPGVGGSVAGAVPAVTQ